MIEEPITDHFVVILHTVLVLPRVLFQLFSVHLADIKLREIGETTELHAGCPLVLVILCLFSKASFLEVFLRARMVIS